MYNCCFNTLFNRFLPYGGGIGWFCTPPVNFAMGIFGAPVNFYQPALMTYETVFSSCVAPQYNFGVFNPFMGTLGLPFTPPTNYCFVPPSYTSNNNFGSLTSQNFSTPIYTAPTNGLSALSALSKPKSTTEYRTYNTNTDLPALKDVGYNKEKAQKLAGQIGRISTECGFDNYCARHVKESIEAAGLGSYQTGHAYQMPSILKRNKNFKEISTKGLNLSSLPAGCILVYEKGVAGYSSQYGHTEITLGNGTAASGGITHDIRAGARVYVPV